MHFLINYKWTSGDVDKCRICSMDNRAFVSLEQFVNSVTLFIYVKGLVTQ